MSGHIYLEGKQVWPTSSGHLYIVYNDGANELVIRGGPSFDFPPWGELKIDAGGLLSQSRDGRQTNDVQARGQVELDLQGRDAADVWDIMLQHALEIQDAHLDYDLLSSGESQNSNSVIASVLNVVGIDIATWPHPANVTSTTEPDEAFPGFDNLLAFNYELLGTERSDIISGFSGNDILSGNRGDDSLTGNSGVDTLDGGAIGPHASNTSTTSVPATGQTLEITLRAPQATDDGRANIAGIVKLMGGTAADYNIAYVFDRSGSMSDPFSGNATVPNANGNSSSNELIDGAIVAFRSLNASIVSNGAGASDVSIIAFSSDATPIYTGRADGGVSAALATLQATNGTNFEAGLQGALSFLQSAGPGLNRVFFISDGENNLGGSFADEVQTLTAASGLNAQIRAIGLGTGANLSQLNQLDNTGGAEVALSPSQLTAGLLGSASGSSDIDRIEISVNNRNPVVVLGSELTATAEGFSFATTVGGLSTTASDVITARVYLSNSAHTSATATVSVANRSDDDHLDGGTDNDTYAFSVGFGTDVINETGGSLDRIVLGSGMVDYKTRPDQTNHNDLDIIIDDIDVIVVKDFFSSGGSHVVERLVLGDGQTVDLTRGLSIQGTGSSDWLRGTDFDDVLIAGAGDDQLVGGTGGGNDVYDGGIGIDTVYYTSASVAMTVNLAASTNQASSSQTGTDILYGIENVVGGSAGDTLSGDDLANTLSGMDGSDALDGGSGNDVLEGGAGNDIEIGGSGSDQITGGDGDDRLFGDAPRLGIGFGSGSYTKPTTATNNSQAQAIDISQMFSLANDTDIANATIMPHVSISATGRNAVDYYKLAISSAGAQITLDIDYGETNSGGFDSYIRILDEQGNVVATNDDSSTTDGAGGSVSNHDSFLTYAVSTPGTYYLVVGSYPNAGPISTGNAYELQVSVVGPNLTITPGDDLFFGDPGHDWIDGGDGSDTLSLRSANSSVTVDLGHGTADGGGFGSDTLVSIENVLGGVGDDSFRGSNQDNIIDGGAGSDTVHVTGNRADYTVSGLAASIQLVDTVAGRDGTDTLLHVEQVAFADGTVAVADLLPGMVSISGFSVTEGNSGSQAATFTVTRTGGAAAFDIGFTTADGTAMAEDGDYAATGGVLHFDAGVASQSVTVQIGGDTMYEADQTFYVRLSGATNGAVIGGATAVGTIVNDEAPPAQVQSAQGTAGNDLIVGTSAADQIDGLAGDDTVFAQGGSDLVKGGAGADTLVGNADIFAKEADTLQGGAGDDIIYGEYTDRIDGGTGYDIAYAVNAYDWSVDLGTSSIELMIADFGNDTIEAGSQAVGVEVVASGGNDVVNGSAFGDRLWAGVGNDIVHGGAGDDMLFGDNGADTLSGDAGNDVIYADAADSISGGDGYDVVYMTTGNGVTIDMAGQGIEFVIDQAGGTNVITAAGMGEGANVFTGAGNDNITGSDHDDVLWSMAGADTLLGGGGADVLVGGIGEDVLNGGTGNDRIYLNSGGGDDGAADTVVVSAGWGADSIYDFVHGSDRIDMTALHTNFGALSIASVNGNALITIGGDQIVVIGQGGTMTTADFQF